MADELVIIAQTVLVEDLVILNGDRVVQRRPPRQTNAAQRFHIFHEAESAGFRNVFLEAVRAKLNGNSLLADGGRGKINLELKRLAIIRLATSFR